MRLIDADANIETMKKCAENPEDMYALLCYRYAQRVLEEAPTVEPTSPWRRVEDGLPVKGEIVIVSDGKRTWDVGQYRCLAFSDGDRTKWWWKGNTIKTVKWWMRKKDALPEPPKEDA